jgi:hypothetical protein
MLEIWRIQQSQEQPIDDGGNLVPPSENPFTNAPPTIINEVDGSKYYHDGIPAGQGDKF